VSDLHDELRDLALQLVACENEDVTDARLAIVKLYERERMVALGILAVQAMTGGPEVDEMHPMLEACRERMCDRLRGLLAWARTTGRL
jgi:hypothetical protein